MKSLFFSLIIVAFVATSCSRQLDKDPFTVVGVTDGNTLLLDNGYKVVLLGIAQRNNAKKKYLKFVMKKMYGLSLIKKRIHWIMMVQT